MTLPLDPAALEVQNPERSSSNKFPRAPTRGHELKRIRGLILHFCSNQATISKKQKLPLDPACLDLQNPKITGPKDDPRAETRHQKSGDRQRHFTRSHAPTQLSHTFNALTRAPLAYDVMDDVMNQVDPFDPDRPANLTRIRTASQKKKKKRKCFDQADF